MEKNAEVDSENDIDRKIEAPTSQWMKMATKYVKDCITADSHYIKTEEIMIRGLQDSASPKTSSSKKRKITDKEKTYILIARKRSYRSILTIY